MNPSPLVLSRKRWHGRLKSVSGTICTSHVTTRTQPLISDSARSSDEVRTCELRVLPSSTSRFKSGRQSNWLFRWPGTLTDPTPTATSLLHGCPFDAFPAGLSDLGPKEFRKMRYRAAYSDTTQSPQRGFLRWQQIDFLLTEISNDYCSSEKKVTSG